MTDTLEINSISQIPGEGIMALASIEYMPPHMDVLFWINGVDDGGFSALEVSRRGEAIGWAIVKIENCNQGSEFVIIAVAAVKGEYGLIEAIAPAWDQLAEANGCGSIRFHTMRRGLLHEMAKYGYGPGEMMFRKVLS